MPPKNILNEVSVPKKEVPEALPIKLDLKAYQTALGRAGPHPNLPGVVSFNYKERTGYKGLVLAAKRRLLSDQHIPKDAPAEARRALSIVPKKLEGDWFSPPYGHPDGAKDMSDVISITLVRGTAFTTLYSKDHTKVSLLKSMAVLLPHNGASGEEIRTLTKVAEIELIPPYLAAKRAAKLNAPASALAVGAAGSFAAAMAAGGQPSDVAYSSPPPPAAPGKDNNKRPASPASIASPSASDGRASDGKASDGKPGLFARGLARIKRTAVKVANKLRRRFLHAEGADQAPARHQPGMETDSPPPESPATTQDSTLRGPDEPHPPQMIAPEPLFMGHREAGVTEEPREHTPPRGGANAQAWAYDTPTPPKDANSDSDDDDDE